MRICHVIETAGGGSGRVVLSLIRHQLAQGHDVTLIASPLRAEKSFLHAAEKTEKLRTLWLLMRREVGLHDIAAVFRLYEILKKAGPFDVIHSHSSKAGGLTRLAGIFLPRTVQIYTPHALVTMDPASSALYRWAERLLSLLCDGIIAVSAYEKQHARNIGIAEKKLHVIPNGVDPGFPADRASARQMLGCAAKNFVIGFVGRLAAQKNPVRAIEAFSLAVRRSPNLRLVLIGEGPLQPEIDRLLIEYKITDRAHVMASRDPRILMPGFDCLLCSSDYEGFPLVFLEALAADVPIVSTPVGGAQEAVLDAQTGFVAESFSSAELATCLQRLAGMPLMQQADMSLRARAHAQNFSAALMAERTEQLYRQLGAKP